MTTTQKLVDGYLRDLRRSLRGVPVERRNEIVSGVEEHLREALAAAPGADEAAVRTVLERIGPPEAIADEARSGLPVPAPTWTPGRVVAAVVAIVLLAGILPALLVAVPWLGVAGWLAIVAAVLAVVWWRRRASQGG